MGAAIPRAVDVRVHVPQNAMFYICVSPCTAHINIKFTFPLDNIYIPVKCLLYL